MSVRASATRRASEQIGRLVEQAGQSAADLAECQVAVAGTDHAGRLRRDLAGPPHAPLAAQHDRRRVRVPGPSTALLDQVGRTKQPGRQQVGVGHLVQPVDPTPPAERHAARAAARSRTATPPSGTWAAARPVLCRLSHPNPTASTRCSANHSSHAS